MEFTRKLAQNSSAVISNLEEGSGGRLLMTERFEESPVCLKSSHQRVQRKFTDGGGGWGWRRWGGGGDCCRVRSSTRCPLPTFWCGGERSEHFAPLSVYPPSHLLGGHNKSGVLSRLMNSGCEEKKRPVLSQTLEIFPECALSSPHARIVPLKPPVRTEGKHEPKNLLEG